MKFGMKKLAPLSALVALGATSASFGQALAATVDITGRPYGVRYGHSIEKNNVVNYAPSGIADNTGRRETPWLAGGIVSSTIEDYAVDWYFNGSESGDTNIFTSGALLFAENNQNNNLSSSNDPGWQFLGTTTGSGLGAIQFSVADQNGGGITNGLDNKKPKGNSPSLIFSYANPIFDGTSIESWVLSLDATDWFVFAFNDPGSKDKDHDDYIGLAHVYAPDPVPVPGALPLMGSVLGGGFLLRRWRNRRTSGRSLA